MRRPLVLAIVALAACGVALDVVLPGPREWLYYHPFTNSVLVGLLLIAATYLVVEGALEERERRRWSEAAGPLLTAIAIAAESMDRELRARSGAAAGDCEALGGLLDRYQAVLTGTPDLIAHWHAALSLAQHARTAIAQHAADASYEGAWARFRTTYADVHDFGTAPARSSETWALPAVKAPT
jgi:hypothetical protein